MPSDVGSAAAGPMAKAEVRQLRRDLADARDEQIVQVVSLVDAMAVRGTADALLEPLRPRLQVLRPQRPATLTRLLFLPLDPVILLPQRWLRDSLGLPRTVLGPLGAQFSQAVPEAAELSRALIGQTLTDRNLVLRVGGPLWKLAAAFFATSEPLPDWTEVSGLSRTVYTSIARVLSLLLSEAMAIERLAQQSAMGDPVPIGQVKACIGRLVSAAAGLSAGNKALALGMLVAILLSRLQASAELISAISGAIAGHDEPGLVQANERAIDYALDSIEHSPQLVGDLSEVADEQMRVALLLEALEAPGPAHRPSLKPRAERLRRQADASCRARFETDLVERVIKPVGQLGPETTDEEVIALENLARDLRRLEATGRMLGGGDHYDRWLRKASETLTMPSPDASCQADRARLVEILLGSNAAMAMVGLSFPSS